MTYGDYHLYRITEGRGAGRVMAVREGFLLLPAVLSLFWALYHRLWLEAVVLFFLSTYANHLFYLHFSLGSVGWELFAGMVLFNVALFLASGSFACDVLRLRYERMNYDYLGCVLAPSARLARLEVEN